MTGTRQKGSQQLAADGNTATAGKPAITRLAAAQQANGGHMSEQSESTAERPSSHASGRKKPHARSLAKTRQRGPHGRSSAHRGVTQHRRTRKWEAHIWDERHQVYLGGFNSEEDAARAHDVMAMKCRGADSVTNFSQDDYAPLLPQLQKLTKDEVRQLLMRKSSSFACGASKSRGVTKHKGGKWEARLGHTKIRKQSYLGLFDTEEAAAKAYDTATIDEFGHTVPTNFDLANYGMASDDSLNDCSFDDHDSSSIEICRVDHSPCSESTVLNKACDSLLDVQATDPVIFPKTCAFPLPLDSLPCGFYSSFPSPLAISPTHPFATPVSSPAPAYNPAIHSLYMDYNLHVNGPSLHCPTPPLGPQLGSLRPVNPNNSSDRPPFLLHQLQMQSFTQTGPQGHGGSSMYTMEHAMDPHHTHLGNPSLISDHTYSSLQGSAELSADMHTLGANANPIHGPEELLHRLESYGCSEMKYTDWHRYTSAAVPSSPPQEGCISRLGTASNGMDLPASPVWSACSPRAGTLLPKSLFNNLDGADFGLDTRESSTYPACAPKAGGGHNVGVLNKAAFSTDTGMNRQAGRSMEGFKPPDRADEHPLLLSQASQPMPDQPPWGSERSATPRLGCFAPPDGSSLASYWPPPANWTGTHAQTWPMCNKIPAARGSSPSTSSSCQPLYLSSFDTLSK